MINSQKLKTSLKRLSWRLEQERESNISELRPTRQQTFNPYYQEQTFTSAAQQQYQLILASNQLNSNVSRTYIEEVSEVSEDQEIDIEGEKRENQQRMMSEVEDLIVGTFGNGQNNLQNNLQNQGSSQTSGGSISNNLQFNKSQCDSSNQIQDETRFEQKIPSSGYIINSPQNMQIEQSRKYSLGFSTGIKKLMLNREIQHSLSSNSLNLRTPLFIPTNKEKDMFLITQNNLQRKKQDAQNQRVSSDGQIAREQSSLKQNSEFLKQNRYLNSSQQEPQFIGIQKQKVQLKTLSGTSNGQFILNKPASSKSLFYNGRQNNIDFNNTSGINNGAHSVGLTQNFPKIKSTTANMNTYKQQKYGLQHLKTMQSSASAGHDFCRKQIKKLETQLNNTKLFLNYVIHDLRNPTNSIDYFLKELLKTLKFDDNCESKLKIQKNDTIKSVTEDQQNNNYIAKHRNHGSYKQMMQTQGIYFQQNMQSLEPKHSHTIQNFKPMTQHRLSVGLQNAQQSGLSIPYSTLAMNSPQVQFSSNIRNATFEQVYQQHSLFARRLSHNRVQNNLVVPTIEQSPLLPEVIENFDDSSLESSNRQNSRNSRQEGAVKIQEANPSSDANQITKNDPLLPASQIQNSVFKVSIQAPQSQHSNMDVEGGEEGDLMPVERTGSINVHYIPESKYKSSFIALTAGEMTEQEAQRRHRINGRRFIQLTDINVDPLFNNSHQNNLRGTNTSKPSHPQSLSPHSNGYHPPIFAYEQNRFISMNHQRGNATLNRQQVQDPQMALQAFVDNHQRIACIESNTQGGGGGGIAHYSNINQAYSRNAASSNANQDESQHHMFGEEQKLQTLFQSDCRQKKDLSMKLQKSKKQSELIEEEKVPPSFVILPPAASSMHSRSGDRMNQPKLIIESSSQSEEDSSESGHQNDNGEEDGAVSVINMNPKGSNGAGFKSEDLKKNSSHVFQEINPLMLSHKQNVKKHMSSMQRNGADLFQNECNNSYAVRTNQMGIIRGRLSSNQFGSSMMMSLPNTRLVRQNSIAQNLFNVVNTGGLILTKEEKKQCECLLKNSLFSSSMLMNLINDLLDLAKIEKNHFNLNTTMFNLHDVIQKALDILDFQAQQKSIKMTYLYEETAIGYFMDIAGDDSRYLQILLNFLSNALKFTPSNGMVTVETRLIDTQNVAKESFSVLKVQSNLVGSSQEIKHKDVCIRKSASLDRLLKLKEPQRYIDGVCGGARRDFSGGRRALGVNQEQQKEMTPQKCKMSSKAVEKYIKFEIRIIDSGYGISKENIGKLFMNFSKLEEHAEGNKRGTGLGLSICKSLIELMGGTVRVESEIGKGTQFIMSLQTKCNFQPPKAIKKWLKNFKGAQQAQNRGEDDEQFEIFNPLLGFQAQIQNLSTNGLPQDTQSFMRRDLSRQPYFGFQNNLGVSRSLSPQKKINFSLNDPQRSQFQEFSFNNVPSQQSKIPYFSGSHNIEVQSKHHQSIEVSSLQKDSANRNKGLTKKKSHFYKQKQQSTIKLKQMQTSSMDSISVGNNNLHQNQIQITIEEASPEQEEAAQMRVGLERQNDQQQFMNHFNHQNQILIMQQPHHLQQQLMYQYIHQFPQSSKLRVLIANDDMFQLQILCNVFRNYGFDATDAENGLVACQKNFHAHKENMPFDVIILDLDMPIMNGFEACQRIRNKDDSGGGDLKLIFMIEPKSKQMSGELYDQDVDGNHMQLIIAVSALITESIAEKIKKAGFDDFIETPITNEKIRIKIENRLEQMHQQYQEYILMQQQIEEDDFAAGYQNPQPFQQINYQNQLGPSYDDNEVQNIMGTITQSPDNSGSVDRRLYSPPNYRGGGGTGTSTPEFLLHSKKTLYQPQMNLGGPFVLQQPQQNFLPVPSATSGVGLPSDSLSNISAAGGTQLHQFLHKNKLKKEKPGFNPRDHNLLNYMQ